MKEHSQNASTNACVSQKYKISLTEDLKDHILLLTDHSAYQIGDSRILSILKIISYKRKANHVVLELAI